MTIAYDPRASAREQRRITIARGAAAAMAANDEACHRAAMQTAFVFAVGCLVLAATVAITW